MELQLISASSAAGEPADCTLIYRLDEGNGRGLPVVNETHPWAGKSICALRDRSGSVPQHAQAISIYRLSNIRLYSFLAIYALTYFGIYICVILD